MMLILAIVAFLLSLLFVLYAAFAERDSQLVAEKSRTLASGAFVLAAFFLVVHLVG